MDHSIAICSIIHVWHILDGTWWNLCMPKPTGCLRPRFGRVMLTLISRFFSKKDMVINPQIYSFHKQSASSQNLWGNADWMWKWKLWQCLFCYTLYFCWQTTFCRPHPISGDQNMVQNFFTPLSQTYSESWVSDNFDGNRPKKISRWKLRDSA